MLLALGITVIIASLVGLFFLLFKRDVPAAAVLALGLVAILGGAIIPSLAAISHVLIGLGSGRTINVDFEQAVHTVQTKATQVTADASEVRAIKDRVEALAKEIKASESQIADMRNNVQMAYRALFETIVFQFDTRSMFPPPQPIMDELNRRLNILGDFAYGGDNGRIAEVQAINQLIAQAMPKPSRTPTPTPTK